MGRADDIRRRFEDAQRRLGAWTAHGIQLTPDLNTLEPPQEDSRLRRVLQATADVLGKPLSEARVLDLGCLEGLFAVEFARHGAKVVAVEGRAANLAKASFAKDVLGLDDLELRLDDVKNLKHGDYGSFDVVLCLGILYHLDAGDAADFLETVYGLCSRAVIIDTHIALEPKDRVPWRGQSYWGEVLVEYPDEASAQDQEEFLWSSIGNARSFQFTRPSLCNLLRHVGFTSVYECLNPSEQHNPDWPRPPSSEKRAVWRNRLTLVAIKGQHASLLSSPITEATPERDHPETPEYLGGWKLPGLPGRRLPRRAAGKALAIARAALRRIKSR